MRSGRFITFEGGEGTGKSTQVQRLAARLLGTGRITVDTTREPGGTPLAERLRSIILTGLAKSAGAEVEAALFAAARSDHLNRRILPALANGHWVLCDRFADSTRVYQALSGANGDVIAQIESEALAGHYPDLTIILDIETEIAAARAAARRKGDAADRFESEGLDFHRAVRRGFTDLARANPDRCVVVDAHGTLDEVEARIWGVVCKRFFVDLQPTLAVGGR